MQDCLCLQQELQKNAMTDLLVYNLGYLFRVFFYFRLCIILVGKDSFSMNPWTDFHSHIGLQIGLFLHESCLILPQMLYVSLCLCGKQFTIVTVVISFTQTFFPYHFQNYFSCNQKQYRSSTHNNIQYASFISQEVGKI